VTDLLVEPMVESDFDEVLAIDVAAFQEARAERDARANSLREELVRSWSRIFVARGGLGAVTGYLVFWHVADEAHVINVAVAPAERRRGVGRALVHALLAYAREHAIVKVLLEVRAGNTAAIGLYRSLGFTEFNVRSRYYPDGEDAVEMVAEPR
jgi:ribosomal-protein-alanine N-acetyltransferase